MILHTMSLYLLVRCVENICFFTGDVSRQHALGIRLNMVIGAYGFIYVLF